MSDFLAANNPCGQNLLQLVATGNAIIAELLRLADFVPPVFKVLNIREAGKYADIIFDFSYFSKQEYYDDLVNGRSVRFRIFIYQRFNSCCFSPRSNRISKILMMNFERIIFRYLHDSIKHLKVFINMVWNSIGK